MRLQTLKAQFTISRERCIDGRSELPVGGTALGGRYIDPMGIGSLGAIATSARSSEPDWRTDDMTIQIEPQHALSPSEIDEIEDRLRQVRGSRRRADATHETRRRVRARQERMATQGRKRALVFLRRERLPELN